MVTRNLEPELLQVDDEPCVQFTIVETSEMEHVVRKLEASVATRNGYRVSCEGTCAKGPQGICWDVKVEFEAESDRDAFLGSLGFDATGRPA